jgi:hypothetical protein
MGGLFFGVFQAVRQQPDARFSQVADALRDAARKGSSALLRELGNT